VEGRVSSPARGIESGHISVAEQQAVAVVTLRRPEKLNALTASMRRELAPSSVTSAAATRCGRFLSRRGAADE
jgi:enoyl-CoA hydratase/carnithine racemase